MATRNVPGDFPTIAAAVAAASLGDTVLVAASYAGHEDVLVTVDSLTFGAPANVSGIVLRADDGVHSIKLAGDSPIAVYGSDDDDTIFGNLGANYISGGGGIDTMSGAGGDDAYLVDNTGDLVFEATGGGNDQVAASLSYALAAGQSVETLQFADSTGTAALNLFGNEVAQTLVGNGGANTLDGRGGADRLNGLAGNDVYAVDNAGDQVIEGHGHRDSYDVIVSSVSYTLAAGQSVEMMYLADPTSTEALNLTSNGNYMQLRGNAGDNIFDALGGGTMQGYGGNDSFVFSGPLSSGPFSRFVVEDFTVGEDTLVLDQTTFAALDLGALDAAAFKIIGGRGAVVDADDRILYEQRSGHLYYDADGSGAGAQLFVATINKTAVLSAADFLVIA